MSTTQVEQIARVAHETNRAYCQSIGDNSQKSWDEAEQWQRDSAVAGVQKVVENPAITPAQLHQEWCGFKTQDGWKYGSVKAPEKKEHPCLVAYDELPKEQRVKDALFRAVVNAML